MAYTPYSTHEMVGVIRHLPQTSNFWLDSFFPRTVTFDTEWIDFDLIDGRRRLAPFVAPTVQGKPYSLPGYETRRFKPAYLKPKHPVDPSRMLTRTAGEMYGGQLTAGARRDAVVADILAEQYGMIRRRWNLMAAEAVINGRNIVEGEDYPRRAIEFGRKPTNVITLSGTGLWTADTSTPYEDLEAWSIQMAGSSGYAVTDWILGRNAWRALINHARTEKMLDSTFRTGIRELDMGISAISSDGAIIQMKGTIGSGIRIWMYSEVYEAEDGTVSDILDPNAVVGVNPQGIQGVRCYGAILDADANYQPLPIFPKNWKNEDPSVEYIMSQSAPLMVPSQPNASFKALVAA